MLERVFPTAARAAYLLGVLPFLYCVAAQCYYDEMHKAKFEREVPVAEPSETPKQGTHESPYHVVT